MKWIEDSTRFGAILYRSSLIKRFSVSLTFASLFLLSWRGMPDRLISIGTAGCPLAAYPDLVLVPVRVEEKYRAATEGREEKGKKKGRTAKEERKGGKDNKRRKRGWIRDSPFRAIRGSVQLLSSFFPSVDSACVRLNGNRPTDRYIISRCQLPCINLYTRYRFIPR